MAKYIAFILLACGIIACSNYEKEAQVTYEKAKTLNADGEYTMAKKMIDSIAILHPKAFETQKAGRMLMKEVLRNEYQRNLKYIDSLLPIRFKEREETRKLFRLEKNKEYQETGEYVSMHEKSGGNITKSQIRVRVDENGELKIESIYVGKTPLDHSSIRVQLPDGMFAECDAVPYDGALNYRYKLGGNYIEIVTYSGSKAQNVAAFIAEAGDAPLQISYLGKRPYVLPVDASTRKTFGDSYKLAYIIQDIQALEKEKLVATKGVVIMNLRLTEETPQNKEKE